VCSEQEADSAVGWSAVERAVMAASVGSAVAAVVEADWGVVAAAATAATAASEADWAVVGMAVAEAEVVPKAPQPSSTSAGGSCRLRRGHTDPKRCSKPQAP
jgi:hypothetical protein